jgi:hypothetical protein
MYGTHGKERERDLVVNPIGRILPGRCGNSCWDRIEMDLTGICGRSGTGFKWLRIQNRGWLLCTP